METAPRMQPHLASANYQQGPPAVLQPHCFPNNEGPVQPFNQLIHNNNSSNQSGQFSGPGEFPLPNQAGNFNPFSPPGSLQQNVRSDVQIVPNTCQNSYFHNKVNQGEPLHHQPDGARWQNGSPMMSASQDPNHQGLPPNVKAVHQNSSPGVYPMNVKRQNVGRPTQFSPMPHEQAGHQIHQQNHAAPQMIQQQHFQQFPVSQQQNVFFHQPPRLDVPSIRPQLVNIGPRLPFPQNGIPSQRPMMMPRMIMNQQENHPPNNQNMPSDSQHTGKRSRFMRTAQILQQSGLMDVTLKTAGLMRENAAIQREIDALCAEVTHIIQQHLANRNLPGAGNMQSMPTMTFQEFPAPQRQTQQNQTMNQLPPQIVLEY